MFNRKIHLQSGSIFQPAMLVDPGVYQPALGSSELWRSPPEEFVESDVNIRGVRIPGPGSVGSSSVVR